MMDLFQSFLHNIHLIKNMLKLQIKSKGVWQVTPTKHDWDHVDFVGQDSTDTKRTRDELQQFWHGLAEDLVQSEQLTSTNK